jgi:putative ABC transport system permease protein
MVMSKQSESLLGNSSGLPRRIQPQLYMHPEVIGVAELAGTGAQFQNIPAPGEKRKEDGVRIMGIDPYVGSITLPRNFSESDRVALLEPFAIAVDKTALKKLGVKLGDRAIINGKKVRVAAVISGFGDVMNTTVVTSRQTLRLLNPGNGRGPTSGPLYVRIKEPARAELVRDQLNAVSHGAYRVWTRAELGEANEAALFKESAIGILLGFSVFIGIVIGIAITSQTMRGAIMANIKEFASLRALGVSMGALRVSILELSWWVGVAGLGMTALLVSGLGMLAGKMGVTMSFPAPTVAFTSVFLVVLALISGMMALGVLKKSQPADLLR